MIDGRGPPLAAGAVVCHDVRDPARPQDVLVRKGTFLASAELQRLQRLAPGQLHVVVPEAGDLAEDAAAQELAAALLGPGVRPATARHGQVTITSERRGFLRVHRDVLDAVNQCDGVLVFTAEADRPTDADVAVGAVKCAPLLLAGATVHQVREISRRRGPVFEVAPFLPRRAALVILDRFGEPIRERARGSLATALRWYGSSLDLVLAAHASVGDVAAAYERAVAAGADVDLILAAGGAATDPVDVLFEGLRQAGGSVEQIGVPADPGTACWLGQLRGRPVLGLASCELFGRPGALDLVLPRILAGEPLDRQLLRRIAYGGLVVGGPPRLPGYHDWADGDDEPAGDE